MKPPKLIFVEYIQNPIIKIIPFANHGEVYSDFGGSIYLT